MFFPISARVLQDNSLHLLRKQQRFLVLASNDCQIPIYVKQHPHICDIRFSLMRTCLLTAVNMHHIMIAKARNNRCNHKEHAYNFIEMNEYAGEQTGVVSLLFDIRRHITLKPHLARQNYTKITHVLNCFLGKISLNLHREHNSINILYIKNNLPDIMDGIIEHKQQYEN